jgi:hypothetical protein
MDTPVANKTENKVNAKPTPPKPLTNQEKIINQLRQEIKNLSKIVKDIQQKQDTQAVIATIPGKLLIKINAYLSVSEVSHSMGRIVSLSELTCDALDVYIWGDEENKRLEEEWVKAEQEKNKKK